MAQWRTWHPLRHPLRVLEVGWYIPWLVPILLLGWLSARLWLSGLPQLSVEYDMAMLELYTRNVFHGGQWLGAYSRFGFHHPGPLMFYLYAPFYEAAGQSFSALLATAVTLNTVCVAAILALFRRRGGPMLGAWVGAAFTVYLLYLEPDVLCSAWNPHVAILPYALALVAFGCFLTGMRWALVIAVTAASLAAQAHIGFVVPLASVAAVGVLVALVQARERRQPKADGSGSAVVPLAVATGVAVVLWLPVLVEQLRGTPGNVTRLARFVLGSEGGHPLPEALAAVGSWLGGFVLAPWGVTSRTELTAAPACAAHAAAFLFVVGLIVVVVLAWGRERTAAVLGALTLASVAGGCVAAMAVTGPLSDYLLRWVSVNGPLAAALTLGVLHIGFGARLADARRRWAWVASVAVPAALTVAVGAAFAVKVARFESLDAVAARPQYQRMAALVDAVDHNLTEDGARAPRLYTTAEQCLSDVAGLALHLEKLGYNVSAEPRLEYLVGPNVVRPGADSAVILTPSSPEDVSPILGELHDVWQRGPCEVLVGQEPDFRIGRVRLGAPEDRLFVDTGFSDPESSRGMTFRWSNGGASRVFLPLDPGRGYAVELDAEPFPVSGRVQCVELSVNGINLGRSRMEHGRATYRWEIPSSAVWESNELVFRYCYAASPKDLGRSEDSRKLAVKFFELRVAPSRQAPAD